MLKDVCTIVAKSKLYQTPAIGPVMQLEDGSTTTQPDYLNAVIQVATTMQAKDLLQALHRIEAKHNRVRKEHWGARTLDLDLLAYENECSNTENLRLPHPRLHERLFVLQPWADIAPNWQHPISGLNITAMIQALPTDKNSLFEGRAWN